MIGPLHHVGLSTPDIDRAIRFYTSLFGFEVIDRSGWGPGNTVRDRQLQATGSSAQHAMLLREGMRLELRLARAEPEFLKESVTFADPDHRWERSYQAVKVHEATTVRVMPDELGPTPEGVSVHDRCNRWMLDSALSMGVQKMSFITVWNGEPGDGAGGTQHMVELVSTRTGRNPEIIDPAKV